MIATEGGCARGYRLGAEGEQGRLRKSYSCLAMISPVVGALPLVPLLITTSLGHVFSSVNAGGGRGKEGGGVRGKGVTRAILGAIRFCLIVGVRAARSNRFSSLHSF